MFACDVPWWRVRPLCGSWAPLWTWTVCGTAGTSGRPGAAGVAGKTGDQVTLLGKEKSHTTHSRQQASLLCQSIKQRFAHNAIESAITAQFWSTHRVKERENPINTRGSSPFLFFFADLSPRLSIDLLEVVSDPRVMQWFHHCWMVDCHFNRVTRATGPKRNTSWKACRLLRRSSCCYQVWSTKYNVCQWIKSSADWFRRSKPIKYVRNVQLTLSFFISERYYRKKSGWQFPARCCPIMSSAFKSV